MCWGPERRGASLPPMQTPEQDALVQAVPCLLPLWGGSLGSIFTFSKLAQVTASSAGQEPVLEICQCHAQGWAGLGSGSTCPGPCCVVVSQPRAQGMLEQASGKQWPLRTGPSAFLFQMQIVMKSISLFPLCGWEGTSTEKVRGLPTPPPLG